MQEFVLDDAWRKNKNKYYYPLVGAIYSDNFGLSFSSSRTFLSDPEFFFCCHTKHVINICRISVFLLNKNDILYFHYNFKWKQIVFLCFHMHRKKSRIKKPKLLSSFFVFWYISYFHLFCISLLWLKE